ncbi:hypothetical protein [Tenacibaculum sp. M341]|uniref:hypothetical protein n=1 Tax=Tenacibaculum sp. M341 TaxID=2530339 RepID=UPI00104C8985|nr:hypothetical protein [Tenacibaculum sp. M341]TCI84760.1 hypothetical protein EYW44_19710 [Tenacibaculum sp. M341]
MKKIIPFLLFIILLSCSSEESTVGHINIEIDSIPEEYKDEYTFNDFKVKVYTNKEDYFNETNPIFSGNLDASGKIAVSEGITRYQSYFVDIYTEDKVLSNWKPADLNVDSSNIIIFYAGDVPSFFHTVYMYDLRALVGEWNFLNFDLFQSYDRAVRNKLVIKKDFTIQSFESYNNVDYTFNYDYTTAGIKFNSITPSEEGYPFHDNIRNPNGLIFWYDHVDKTLRFQDYSFESVTYKK